MSPVSHAPSPSDHDRDSAGTRDPWKSAPHTNSATCRTVCRPRSHCRGPGTHPIAGQPDLLRSAPSRNLATDRQVPSSAVEVGYHQIYFLAFIKKMHNPKQVLVELALTMAPFPKPAFVSLEIHYDCSEESVSQAHPEFYVLCSS